MLYENFGKRMFDIVFSFLLLILLFPIFFIIGILIKLDSEGPIIFKHKRLGKNCREIYVWKFRTMVKNAMQKGPQFTSFNDNRITKIGKFLRETSIDELPQLINVFKGDMSFIGPRPDIYTETPTEKQNKRSKVLPGITGLAQINGRSQLNSQKKEEYDLEYVKNISLLNDFKIIIKTIKVVLLKKGVN